MIFSRSRGSGRHAKGDENRHGARRATQRESGPEVEIEDEDEGAETESGRAIGPYDINEAPDGIAQLDLGALRVPAVEGVEVRVQADDEGRVQQVVLVHEGSALQLGAFAAPRSEGIWDEVRGEIRKQLFNDGVGAEEVDGEYGTELRARVRGADGLTDIRFVGIDGPRWLVRAVYQGPAAVDPSVSPPLVECLRNLVVDRGHEAMPVRDPLPLRLPRAIAEQGLADADEGAQAGSRGSPANGSAPSRRKPSPRPRRK